MTQEFVCEKCGIKVWLAIPEEHNESIYCAVCRFLDGIEDEMSREEAEKFCKKIGLI